MEKRDNEIVCSHLTQADSLYLVMQGKLLHIATISVNKRIGSTLYSKIKGSCMGRKQESMFESGALTYISWILRSTNFVFSQILYQLEAAGSNGPTNDQVKASFLFPFKCCSPLHGCAQSGATTNYRITWKISNFLKYLQGFKELY